mmetsp:Transcript_37251/g.87268  ORF Transcript_37251/g.87268 Transcript_37251/m.87268 type:complete len:210 (-) Transcript_37251:20-649(-)
MTPASLTARPAASWTTTTTACLTAWCSSTSSTPRTTSAVASLRSPAAAAGRRPRMRLPQPHQLQPHQGHQRHLHVHHATAPVRRQLRWRQHQPQQPQLQHQPRQPQHPHQRRQPQHHHQRHLLQHHHQQRLPRHRLQLRHMRLLQLQLQPQHMGCQQECPLVACPLFPLARLSHQACVSPTQSGWTPMAMDAPTMTTPHRGATARILGQ